MTYKTRSDGSAEQIFVKSNLPGERISVGQAPVPPVLELAAGIRSTANDPLCKAGAHRPGARTSLSNSLSIADVRSWSTPECTGEVWMMVLRGATSQWKRSRC